MRKVKVAAIQPKLIPEPPHCALLSSCYRCDPDEILRDYIRAQLAVTTALLCRAGESGCDIVCSCEDACGIARYGMDAAHPGMLRLLAEKSQGLVEDAFSQIAKKYHMYIVGAYLAVRENRVYNLATLFDRKGESVGAYRKTHLPASERWQCNQGDALDVFELDFGKVGVCICYDMMFPETVRTLALKGAEIVFHPTFGYNWYDSIGEATLRVRANDNGIYIVASKDYYDTAAGKSCIVDPWGQVLVDAGFEPNALIVRELSLHQPKLQSDTYMSAGLSGIADAKERLSRERRPELYGEICASKEKDIPVATLAKRPALLQKVKRGILHW